MQQFLSDSDPDVETIAHAVIDFGFHHLFKDVARMYAEYTNKDKYGYDGGVMDQPEEYWNDMETMRWLELWIKHVATIPRIEQVSVFHTIRKEGRLSGKWANDNG
jgi:hypothetical protein